jgi:GTP-binding protein HflX
MVYSTQPRAERAILVGVVPESAAPAGNGRTDKKGDGGFLDGASLEELGLLAQTAGCEIAGRLRQARASIHPATFVSKGKLAQLQDLIAAHEASLVVVDADLSPAQMRNLEGSLERKVVDRTELILDIFATRARTREAQVQVELAQLQYLLPRLTRLWGHLERQEGGIGTRGPGEKQLEVDRRLVRERISILKRRLEEIESDRCTRTRRRRRVFRAALVGYTNAGKSTLFNAVTRAGVLEEDRLFATLDTTTRRLGFEAGRALLLSDTVGFIRKLPHHLVASFRATLGEVREADLIVHVVDAAHASMRQQMAAVDAVTEELLEGRGVSRLLVLNKADLLTEEQALGLRAEFPAALLLSARDRAQARALKDAIAAEAREQAAGQAAPHCR